MVFTLVPQFIDGLHVFLGSLVLALVIINLFVIWKLKQHVSGTQPKKPVEVSPLVKNAEPESAQQLLALLQTEARMVDFLKEDVEQASDADIGAVARTVHSGAKKVLEKYIDIAPVRIEDEESTITLPEGYDAAAVRITGNVTGRAPFTGRLIHKGWKVVGTRLPKITSGHDVSIIAPAEVEL